MAEAEDKPELLELLPSVVGNIGFCFTDMDVVAVREVLNKYQVQSSAKAGIIAPLDVIIPAGPTGMGPEKTSFFQALNLPTKITKGSIEILTDVTVVHVGTKVRAPSTQHSHPCSQQSRAMSLVLTASL
jgi:large subunit ribosomal protein LP0